MGSTCFCTVCLLCVRGRLGTVLHDALRFRILFANLESSRLTGSFCCRRCCWVVYRSLPTIQRLGGDPSLSLPARIGNIYPQSLIFVCKLPLYRLDKCRQRGDEPGLSMSASKIPANELQRVHDLLYGTEYQVLQGCR